MYRRCILPRVHVTIGTDIGCMATVTLTYRLRVVCVMCVFCFTVSVHRVSLLCFAVDAVCLCPLFLYGVCASICRNLLECVCAVMSCYRVWVALSSRGTYPCVRTGVHELTISTWEPVGSVTDRVATFFVGGTSCVSLLKHTVCLCECCIEHMWMC